MDTLKLAMVSVRGGGVHIHGEGVDVTVVFGTLFTRAVAKVLELEWLYKQESNGGLRGFVGHETGIVYKDADVSFKRAENDARFDVGLSTVVDDINIVAADAGTMLKFRVKFPITNPEMTTFLAEVRKEAIYQVVIKGKQKEFDFEKPEKKRGRPKKDKPGDNGNGDAAEDEE